MSVFKTCPYCGGHGYINQFEDVEGGCRAWANECIVCKGTGAILVPETNADRIRRMSDEELAEFLAEEQFRIANVVFQTVGYGLEKQAIYARRLDWLQQLYEGE